MHLPLRWGGLGLFSLVDVQNAALVGATAGFLANGDPLLRPLFWKLFRLDSAEWVPAEMCKRILDTSFDGSDGSAWPIRILDDEDTVMLDDNPVAPAARVQHEIWERMQGKVLQGWCSELENFLSGKWSDSSLNADPLIIKQKESLALLRSRTTGKSHYALFKHTPSVPFFLSDDQFITHLRLNMAQSPVRNPVLLELKVCPLCKLNMTPSHPLYCNRSAGQATIGRHNASLRVMRSIFSKHRLALSLEKRLCEPVRPNTT